MALVLALSTAPGPASAAETAEYPQLAGTTIIEGTGVAGITMRVPRTTTPTEYTPTIHSEDASFVFLGISSHDDCGAPESYLFCVLLASYFVPDFSSDWTLFGYKSTPATMEPGLVDFYIVSDGYVRVTAHYPELGGTIEVEATGAIQAGAEALPVRCPPAGCSHMRMGGAARDLVPNSFVSALAYSVHPEARPPGIQDPGSNHVNVCFYPNRFDSTASPDPADHPLGCDFIRAPVTDEYNTGQGMSNVINFAVGSPFGSLVNMWGFSPGGETYGGYTVAHTGFPDGWHAGAWFVWLEEGVACPTGDWTNCNAAT